MSDTTQAIIELRQSVDALTVSNNARMDSIEDRVETKTTEVMNDLTTTLVNPLVAKAALSAQDANNAASVSIQGGRVYDDTTGGTAVSGGVPSGQNFMVRSPNVNEYVVEYKNMAGSAVATGKTLPSANAIKTLATLQTDYLRLRGAMGFVHVRITGGSNSEILTPGVKIKKNMLDLIGMKMLTNPDGLPEIRVKGAMGFYKTIAGGVDDAKTYGARNSSNLDASARVLQTINAKSAALYWNYNHIQYYGQSLSQGQQAHPALTKTSRNNSVMIGGCVRPATVAGASFTPLGGTLSFQPLLANVQDSATGALLTDEQVAALPISDGALGEAPVVGTVNFLKAMHNTRKGVIDDPDRILIGGAYGVGGRSIEQLSKGATPELWQRLVGATQAAKNLAAAQSKTYGIAALVYMQGENNYDASLGFDTTLEGYLAKQIALRNNWLNDCVVGIAGQTQEPAMFIYQTGSYATRDATALSIGMAQLRFSREVPNVYMVGPTYPYTDVGIHMDPNSSRQWGMQAAKVMHRVLNLRQDWKPLSPIAVKRSKTVISIDYHVPAPPLRWDRPYQGYSAIELLNKGYRVTDDNGDVSILSVRIVFDTIVEIKCARAFVGTPYVWQAGELPSFYGQTNLCDSDATLTTEVYEYMAGSGQSPNANIPALLNKPYSLANWAVASYTPATL